MFYLCIPKDVGSIAEPFTVLGIAVALLGPDVPLLDEPHEPATTTHNPFGVSQAERHTVHHPHDGLVPLNVLYVITHRHKV